MEKISPVKKVLFIIICLAALEFLAMALGMSVFGGTVWDKLVYLAGTVITAAAACAVVNVLRFKACVEGLKTAIGSGSLQRVVCFSIAILMTLYYYDSASDYGHMVGLRIMVLMLGVAALLYGGGSNRRSATSGSINNKVDTHLSETINKKSALECISYIPGCIFAAGWMGFGLMARSFVAAAGALNYDAISFLAINGEFQGREALFWNIMAALPAPVDGKAAVPYVLWGLMVLVYIEAARRVCCVFVSAKNSLSPFGVLVLVFLLALAVTANGRIWVIAVIAPVLALYFCGRDRDVLLKELAYGVMLSFWVMLGFALLFRPYYSFEFVRYPGWFASVASAALYRMVVAVASLIGLVAAIDGQCRVYEEAEGFDPQAGLDLKGGLRELPKQGGIGFCAITLSLSLSTLLMGMSRTSILGTGVVFIFVLVVSQLVKYRTGMKYIIGRMALIFACFVMALPCAYTAIRCIPALVSRPVWVSGPEWFSDRIIKGDSPASSKYMNVPQLAESLLEKLAGIDINLSYMAGAESGPGDAPGYDKEGNFLGEGGNVVDTYKGSDGQMYQIRDYTFSNDSDNSGENGRLEILAIYSRGLNMTGHATMMPDDAPEDMIIYHAHNTFMQVAHDHGIVTGILFGLLCAGGVVCGVIYYRRNCGRGLYSLYPAALILCFSMAGMTEWIFHPSIPVGLCFMVGLVPLMDGLAPRSRD